MQISVLGIDLASGKWSDNGSSLVSFQPGDAPEWRSVRSPCLSWPSSPLDSQSMATHLLEFIRKQAIVGVSLDGPQGWREPNAGERPGVGRWCEYEARCQGKTGEYPRTYPGTQRVWIEFCIDLFRRLRRAGGRDVPATAVDSPIAPRSGDEFWLIECFPTSIWRQSQLPVLPGKAKCRRDAIDLQDYRQSLSVAYGLPIDRSAKWSHDDLQSLVAALPMAALLGGPACPVRHGKESLLCGEGRWCEGYLWDCTPLRPTE